ncbi:MAG: DUF3108 domain-containing protein [Bacteroidota bacterium]
MKKIITKFGLFLLLIPLLVAASPAALNQGTIRTDFEPCETDNDAFQDAEEIVYKIYYNWNFVWLSAGEVVFRVLDDGDEYHLSAKGRTYKSYEWFFKVRDDYDTYINKETMLPRLSIRDIHEGNYRRYDKVTFDQTGRTATSLKGKTRDDATAESFNLDGCMHDILSIMYLLRNVDASTMNVGDKLPIEIFFDRETFPLQVKYLGDNDNMKIKGQGRFRTHTFSPQLIAGEVFKEGDEMTVHVSKDKNKIPLMIESPVSVGSVKVVLKSYKNLRHEFTAKN